MTTIRRVERKIERTEGFRVTIRHLDGRNVRGDRQRMPNYPFERAMKNAANVKRWREQRFVPTYPGFRVDVLGVDGAKAHGGTLLGTVRDTYLD
ncbi:MAG: hypothetical protein ACR2OD_00475 [Gaiellaceae bacterium]